MVDIVDNTLENILKQIFPQIFHYFGPVTSSFPKKALFAYFEQILSDFGLLFNYNVEITP